MTPYTYHKYSQCAGVADFEMEAYTPRDYGYKVWSTVEHRQVMFFATVACSDIHILLSERLNKHHGFSYEIVIGGWNNSRLGTLTSSAVGTTTGQAHRHHRLLEQQLVRHIDNNTHRHHSLHCVVIDNKFGKKCTVSKLHK